MLWLLVWSKSQLKSLDIHACWLKYSFKGTICLGSTNFRSCLPVLLKFKQFLPGFKITRSCPTSPATKAFLGPFPGCVMVTLTRALSSVTQHSVTVWDCNLFCYLTCKCPLTRSKLRPGSVPVLLTSLNPAYPQRYFYLNESKHISSLINGKLFLFKLIITLPSKTFPSH